MRRGGGGGAGSMAQASQERSHHVDGVTTACAIRVTSNYGSPVDLVWLAFDGEPKRYATLEAGEAHAQSECDS